MRQLLTELVISDDDYFDIGGDNMTLVKNLVGELAYYQSRVGFEVEFVDRNWNNQTQTIRIYIVGNYRDLFWFKIKYTPKI
jgi:hypothetical protein